MRFLGRLAGGAAFPAPGRDIFITRGRVLPARPLGLLLPLPLGFALCFACGLCGGFLGLALPPELAIDGLLLEAPLGFEQVDVRRQVAGAGALALGGGEGVELAVADKRAQVTVKALADGEQAREGVGQVEREVGAVGIGALGASEGADDLGALLVVGIEGIFELNGGKLVDIARLLKGSEEAGVVVNEGGEVIGQQKAVVVGT
jgi:hypothetical protein